MDMLPLAFSFCFLVVVVQSHQNVIPRLQSISLRPPVRLSSPPLPRPPPLPQQSLRLPLPPPPKSVNSAPITTIPESKHSNHGKNHHNSTGETRPPIKKKMLNRGKKLGLMFVGVAAILQVCVLAFLIIKRQQLLKADG